VCDAKQKKKLDEKHGRGDATTSQEEEEEENERGGGKDTMKMQMGVMDRN